MGRADVDVFVTVVCGRPYPSHWGVLLHKEVAFVDLMGRQESNPTVA